MIKHLTLALALVSSSAFASSIIGHMSHIPDVENTSKKGFHGQIGLGVTALPDYIGGDSVDTSLLPLINVNYNDRFYFNANRLGAWVYHANYGIRVGGVITAHAGYDASDLPDYLQDNLVFERKDSIMAGVNAEFKRGGFSAEAGVLTDISSTSDGSKSYIQMGYTVLTKPKYSLKIIAKAEMLDNDLTKYYYNSYYDETSTTPDYVAKSATNITLGAVGTYKINNKWTAMGAITTTSLDDEIADSPLVEDDTHNMVLVGITYSF